MPAGKCDVDRVAAAAPASIRSKILMRSESCASAFSAGKNEMPLLLQHRHDHVLCEFFAIQETATGLPAASIRKNHPAAAPRKAAARGLHPESHGRRIPPGPECSARGELPLADSTDRKSPPFPGRKPRRLWKYRERKDPRRRRNRCSPSRNNWPAMPRCRRITVIVEHEQLDRQLEAGLTVSSS